MKKFINISFIICASLFSSNSFGMLVQKSIAYTKKNNTYCSINKLLLTQLVQNRRQLKERNNNLIELLTEQNIAINQLNKFDRPMTALEYFLTKDKISACAQRLLELEQQKKE